jgi:hypothetical protein
MLKLDELPNRKHITFFLSQSINGDRIELHHETHIGEIFKPDIGETGGSASPLSLGLQGLTIYCTFYC